MEIKKEELTVFTKKDVIRFAISSLSTIITTAVLFVASIFLKLYVVSGIFMVMTLSLSLSFLDLYKKTFGENKSFYIYSTSVTSYINNFSDKKIIGFYLEGEKACCRWLEPECFHEYKRHLYIKNYLI